MEAVLHSCPSLLGLLHSIWNITSYLKINTDLCPNSGLKEIKIIFLNIWYTNENNFRHNHHEQVLL